MVPPRQKAASKRPGFGDLSLAEGYAHLVRGTCHGADGYRETGGGALLSIREGKTITI
ncbi:hypothetical protein MESS4_720109 [Mesorhizobium sp. STM 4661]|nr:hypothetical protein MESS4_720109 [Mesorhizobium sp. STM 4661]